MVSKRHLSIRDNTGGTTANSTLRLFRRIYNCIKADLEDSIPANPVSILSAKKQWAKSNKRKTTVKDNDLSAWFTAVLSLENQFAKNLLLLELFTGMRKSECYEKLIWDNVDMRNKMFTLPETKNEKTLTLPMSNYLFDIFKQLQSMRLSKYVFPALVKRNMTGHMADPRRQTNKIKDKTGIKFTPHDLRRTFKTIAQNTVTISENHSLTNHSTGNAGDSYIILTTDKLREPMQRVTDRILALAGRDKNGKPRSIYIGMSNSVRDRLIKSIRAKLIVSGRGYSRAYKVRPRCPDTGGQ